jgi:hypothetical protein
VRFFTHLLASEGILGFWEILADFQELEAIKEKFKVYARSILSNTNS